MDSRSPASLGQRALELYTSIPWWLNVPAGMGIAYYMGRGIGKPTAKALYKAMRSRQGLATASQLATQKTKERALGDLIGGLNVARSGAMAGVPYMFTKQNIDQGPPKMMGYEPIELATLMGGAGGGIGLGWGNLDPATRKAIVEATKHGGKQLWQHGLKPAARFGAPGLVGGGLAALLGFGLPYLYSGAKGKLDNVLSKQSDHLPVTDPQTRMVYLDGEKKDKEQDNKINALIAEEQEDEDEKEAAAIAMMETLFPKAAEQALPAVTMRPDKPTASPNPQFSNRPTPAPAVPHVPETRRQLQKVGSPTAGGYSPAGSATVPSPSVGQPPVSGRAHFTGPPENRRMSAVDRPNLVNKKANIFGGKSLMEHGQNALSGLGDLGQQAGQTSSRMMATLSGMPSWAKALMAGSPLAAYGLYNWFGGRDKGQDEEKYGSDNVKSLNRIKQAAAHKICLDYLGYMADQLPSHKQAGVRSTQALMARGALLDEAVGLSYPEKQASDCNELVKQIAAGAHKYAKARWEGIKAEKKASNEKKAIGSLVGPTVGMFTAPEGGGAEGLVRGGFRGSGTDIGGLGGLALGGMSKNPLIALLAALAGAGAGYGVSGKMIGKPSWQVKRSNQMMGYTAQAAQGQSPAMGGSMAGGVGGSPTQMGASMGNSGSMSMPAGQGVSAMKGNMGY